MQKWYMVFVVFVSVFLHSCGNYIQDISRISDADAYLEEQDNDINDDPPFDCDNGEEDTIQEEDEEREVDEDVITEEDAILDDDEEMVDRDELPDDEPFQYPSSNDTSPIDLEGVEAHFYADISYGDAAAHHFDMFIVPSETPTPLVIFIHGGGFAGGDKNEAYSNAGPFVVRDLLRNGISFATINYRLFEEDEKEGVIKPLTDCKRALQFIRSISHIYHIKKSAVALYGFSAGAGASMWIGFQDDMAQPDSDDPISRESTRVRSVGLLETQATYDLVKWETEVFRPFNVTLEGLANLGFRKMILDFYAAPSLDDLYTPEFVEYRKKVDMLAFISSDDPEMFVHNAHNSADMPFEMYGLLHHPYHAEAIMKKAEEKGADGVFYIDAMGISDPSNEQLVPFLIRTLIE